MTGYIVPPLWARALVSRAVEQSDAMNRSASARVALVELIARAGEDVSLIEVHMWSRDLQGRAYVWAIATIAGICSTQAPWRHAA